MQKTAIISFDLDGERAFGPCDRLQSDRFLESGVPAIVEYLDRYALDATFFAVGRNVLDFPHVHSLLRRFEIGNHTHSHLPGLTRRDDATKAAEVRAAHDAIREFFGVAPTMFRAPDYQIDAMLYRLVMDMGYVGDSSLINVRLPLRYRVHYRRHRALAAAAREYPLTSWVIPFNGTTAISLGLRYTQAVLDRLLETRDVLFLNFHARDFTNLSIGHFGYAGRRRAHETTTRFLDLLRSRCQLTSYRGFLS